ncbi:Fc.00g040850.m01.CDS01 [Cosmosporella sp. VM-42]
MRLTRSVEKSSTDTHQINGRTMITTLPIPVPIVPWWRIFSKPWDKVVPSLAFLKTLQLTSISPDQNDIAQRPPPRP